MNVVIYEDIIHILFFKIDTLIVFFSGFKFRDCTGHVVGRGRMFVSGFHLVRIRYE